MEAAIHDLVRMLEAFPREAAVPEVEIELVSDELDDPWFVDEDSVVVVTEDAQFLDRSLRINTAVLAVA